jgi:hypothetical protein
MSRVFAKTRMWAILIFLAVVWGITTHQSFQIKHQPAITRTNSKRPSDTRIDANLGDILRCKTKVEVECILGPARAGIPPGAETSLSQTLQIWHWQDDEETFFIGLDEKGRIQDKDADWKDGRMLPPCCYHEETFFDRILRLLDLD